MHLHNNHNWPFAYSLIDRRSDQSERGYYVPPLSGVVCVCVCVCVCGGGALGA